MRVKEILARLTGVSLPSGVGVQWQPSKVEVTVAREVVTFLEDRRVLYAPHEVEIPEHCVDSVLEVRRFLTTKITEAGEKSDLGASLRAMRAACRKFLDRVDAEDLRGARSAFDRGYAGWIFWGALGELRGVFGIHVARIAAAFALDVEDRLAAILPAEDAAEDAPHEQGRRRARRR